MRMRPRKSGYFQLIAFLSPISVLRSDHRLSFNFIPLPSGLYCSFHSHSHTQKAMLRIISLHVSNSARILQALRARGATAQVQPRASTTQSWQIPAASRIPSRWSSSALFSRVLHPRYGLSLPRSPLSTPYIRRPFSSGASFNSRQQHTYNRFGGGGGGGGRQSLFFTAIQQARPIHFVGIGLGVSGIYLYNTETVDVSKLRYPEILRP